MKNKLLKVLLSAICLATIGAIGFISEQVIKMSENNVYAQTNEDNYYSYEEIVSRLIDPKQLAYQVDENSKQHSSYDRYSSFDGEKYYGWDGNGDRNGVLEKTRDGGYVIAEMEGPGYISRIWSAMGHVGQVKIYVDDKETPVIDCDMEKIFRDYGHPNFAFENLSYDASQGDNTYVPITYNEYCKVVVYNPGGYYLVNYTELPQGSVVESFKSSLTASQKKALRDVDTFFERKLGTNPSGKEDGEIEAVTISKQNPYVKTLDGRGAIEGLTFKVNTDAPKNSDTMVRLLKLLQLRIYWNGEENPSVDVPLGDFVGSGYGLTDVKTIVAGVRDDKTIYSYYYMPYLEGARIELVNLDDTEIPVEISFTTGELDEKASTYKFCALWNRGKYTEDLSRMPDYNFINVEGKGKIVGVNLHHYKWLEERDPTAGPGSYWWGEGDEKFYVDGEDFPSWFGTGTEDFFGYAWCDANKFSKPFHAQSYCVGGSLSIGNRCLTRIFMGEALPFDESFNGYFEKYYKDDYIKYAFTTTFYLSLDGSFEKNNYSLDEYLSYFKYDPQSQMKNIVEAENVEYLYCDGEIIEQSVGQTDAIRLSNGKNILWKNDVSVGGKYSLWCPSGDVRQEYVVLVSTLLAKDYGKFRVYINNQVVNDGIDLYSNQLNIDSLIEIGKTTLNPGYNNKIIFECIGKNEKSSGYNLGLDFLIAIPASEYSSLNEVDLLKYTDVTRSVSNKNNNVLLKYDAENFRPVTSNPDAWSVQEMTNFGDAWSMNKQILWYASKMGNELSIKFNSSYEGSFNLELGLAFASDFGLFEVAVNGVNLKQIDMYYEYVKHFKVDIGVCDLLLGENVITFRTIGKNPKSANMAFGFDYMLYSRISSDKTIINYEVENRDFTFNGNSMHSNQNMSVFGDLWSNNQQLLWNSAQLGNSVSFTINSETAIKAKLVVGFTIAVDMGIYEVYVNGNKVGTSTDLYNEKVTKTYRSFGECNLVKGTNTITFKAVGKNALAIGYNLGLDNLLFYL